MIACLAAPVPRALALSILIAIAWAVQQCIGNSGRVDVIRTFLQGLVGAGSAFRPLRPALHIAVRTTRITAGMFFPLPPQTGATS
jgi:steroid 5-alpha reductase family enzyme